MTQQAGKSSGAVDPRALDIFEFARSAWQAAGTVSVSALPRMLNEVPPEASERESAFTWQAQGSTQPELREDGSEASQSYLRLAVHGAAWLQCQRCLAPYEQAFDVDAAYRLVKTEEEAEQSPLDDDETDVIVGSRQFDLVDLIEEELLLSLPLVPKHERCPEVHESLSSGRGEERADGAPDDEAPDDEPRNETSGKPNPFAVLETLKHGGTSGKKH